MKNRIINILNKPLFIVLLPLFYFLHRWEANYNPILYKEFFSLFLLYSAIAIGITFIAFLFYKNIHKAALASSVLLGINFFFIEFFEIFKKFETLQFISKISVSLILTFIILIILLYLLKKTKKTLLPLCSYLNLLLIVLIVIDGIFIFKQNAQNSNRIANSEINQELKKCDTCSKPDIYLIVTDEYAGAKQLKEVFGYDNESFYAALKQRGFHIIQNSSSNYNSTIYSMASMFSMSYLTNLGKQPIENYKDMLYCREVILNNSFTNFLENKEGYEIYNYSFLDIGDKRRVAQNMFSTERNILSGITLTNRLKYIFGARFASEKRLLEIKMHEKIENDKVEKLLLENISDTFQNNKPKFVYTHFNMPHWPYYFDSIGNTISPDKFTESYKSNKSAYLQYMKYCNKKLLYLIDNIKQKSARPPVIILLSDHGFRQIPSQAGKESYFINLNSVYLPSGDFSQFKDNMSNVNEFRAILNTFFNQNLPLLKDSTQYIQD